MRTEKAQEDVTSSELKSRQLWKINNYCHSTCGILSLPLPLINGISSVEKTRPTSNQFCLEWRQIKVGPVQIWTTANELSRKLNFMSTSLRHKFYFAFLRLNRQRVHTGIAFGPERKQCATMFLAEMYVSDLWAQEIAQTRDYRLLELKERIFWSRRELLE